MNLDDQENDSIEADIENIWMDVAERRLAEMKSGKVVGVDAFDAIKQMRESFRA